MPRVRHTDIDVKVGDWVYLNVKKNAVWRDPFSEISLDVWGKRAQQIPDICDEDDLERIRKAVAFGRLFVSDKEPPKEAELAQEKGERDIYLRELLTHSTEHIKEQIGNLSNTAIECLLNLELQRPKPRKTLIDSLKRKIKKYAAELAIGIDGGGKDGIVESYIRKPVKEGQRPLKRERPDTPLGKEPEAKDVKTVNRRQ
jgi:hypothetical protein